MDVGHDCRLARAYPLIRAKIDINQLPKKCIFQSFSQFQLMLSSHPKLYTETGKIQSVFRTCCIEYTRKTQRAGKYLKKCQNILFNQIDRQRIW